MASPLRHRVLTQVFGNGFGGYFAATTTGWLIDQFRGAFDDSGTQLVNTRLRPGESYIITTRPPMSRRERRMVDKRDALDRKIEAASVPTRSTIRLAKRYNRTTRRAERARVGGRRRARLVTRSEVLGRKLDRRLEPSKKTAQQIRARNTLNVAIEARADQARRSAKGVRRPSKPRMFR